MDWWIGGLMDSYGFYPCSRYSALLILLARNYLSNKSVSEFNKSICCLCILQNLFFILCLLVLLLVDVYQAIIEIWLMPLQKLYKARQSKAKQIKSNQIKSIIQQKQSRMSQNLNTKRKVQKSKMYWKTESLIACLLACLIHRSKASKSNYWCMHTRMHASKQASTTQKQIMCFCLLERLASWESSVT